MYFLKRFLQRWLEACLSTDLPTASELEGALRNGIIVAKLGTFFAPEIVSERKIYDINEKVYKVASFIYNYCRIIYFLFYQQRKKNFQEKEIRCFSLMYSS